MCEKVILEVGGTYAELTPKEAGLVAVAMNIANESGSCNAPGALCEYCPSKDCTRPEAVKAMKKAMKETA